MCFSCADKFPGGIDVDVVNKIVNDFAIQCDYCDTWFHSTCLKHEKWRVKNSIQEDSSRSEILKEFTEAKDQKLKGLDHFRCPKCTHWSQFLRS